MARKKKPERRGRPPILLDRQRTDELLSSIRAGVPIVHSATRVGIAPSSFMAWCARGRSARDRAAAGYAPEPDDDMYMDFLDRVERARADASASGVATIQKAARGGYLRKERTYTDESGRLIHEKEYADVDWRAAAWLLERSFRAEFGKAQYIEVNAALEALGTLGIPLPGAGPSGGSAGSLDESTLSNLHQRLIEAKAAQAADGAPLPGEEPVDAEIIED